MSGVYEFKEGSTTLFKFLEMTPSPSGPRQQQTYLTRANVDEYAIYIDGIRGEMFTMQTTADSQNETTGEALIKGYEDKVGYVVEIHYQGINYGKYLIDNVQANGYSILKMVGGVNHSDSKFMIESQWSILPLNPPPAP
jgi:hypothetical protein